MENKVFFDLGSELSPTTFLAPTIDLHIDEFKLIKGDYQGVEFPINFKQENGKKLKDVLDTGYPGFYLISEKMRNILQENELTGWKVFPIKLYDTKSNEIIGYHGFSVTGRSGPTSYKTATIIEKRLVPNAPLIKYYKGVFIDQWDGTDFFTPEGTIQTFITKKAYDVLKKNKLTNIYLESLADMEMPVDCVKKTPI